MILSDIYWSTLIVHNNLVAVFIYVPRFKFLCHFGTFSSTRSSCLTSFLSLLETLSFLAFIASIEFLNSFFLHLVLPTNKDSGSKRHVPLCLHSVVCRSKTFISDPLIGLWILFPADQVGTLQSWNASQDSSIYYFNYSLSQAFSNGGPRAKSGPRRPYRWSACKEKYRPTNTRHIPTHWHCGPLLLICYLHPLIAKTQTP